MKKGAGRLEIILSIRLPVREIEAFVRGQSSTGVSLGTRDATTVVQRRKIASSRPVTWSSCPVCVNKISQMYFICAIFDAENFIHGVAKCS